MSIWADPPAAPVVPMMRGGGAGPMGKRLFDLAAALSLLPLLGLVIAVLWALNPLFNPGPLIFRQERMGRGGQAFTMIKLRTMRPGPAARGPEAPLETGRITPLGALLRRVRLDELPQILNMLRGEMSFVGPRPDCMSHALEFVTSIPGYRARHAVRPGLTGLAQVSLGYAEGAAATREKVRADLAYIAAASWATDLRILGATAAVILCGRGR